MSLNLYAWDRGVTVPYSLPTTHVDNTSEIIHAQTIDDLASAINTVSGGIYNVKEPQYGATGNGTTDDTAAIRAALTAAGNAGGGIVFLPPGTYLISAHSYAATDASALTLYANCVLLGAGAGKSVLKVNPASVPNATGTQNCYALRYQSSCVIEGVEIDGNKANIPTSAMTDLSAALLYAHDAGRSGVRVRRCRIHDCPGKTAETFAWMCSDSETDVVADDVELDHNAGTGLTTSGTAATHGARVTLLNLRAHDNGANGVSVFFTDDAALVASRCYSNTFAGLNAEWANTLRASACRLDNNGTGSIQTYGCVNGWVLDCVLSGGQYNLISHASTQLSQTGTVNGLELRRCKLIAPGTRSIHVEESTSPTVGVSYPQIVLDSSEGDGYTLETGAGTSPLPAGTRYLGLQLLAPVTLGAVDSASWSGGLTKTAFSGSGNQSSHAATLSASAVNQSWDSGTVLKAGKTYLIRVRTMIATAAQRWVVQCSDAGFVQHGITLNLPINTADLNGWVESHLLYSVPTSGDHRMSFVNTFAGASVLNVDWATAAEVLSLASSS